MEQHKYVSKELKLLLQVFIQRFVETSVLTDKVQLTVVVALMAVTILTMVHVRMQIQVDRVHRVTVLAQRAQSVAGALPELKQKIVYQLLRKMSSTIVRIL
jgi:hypothetical protein